MKILDDTNYPAVSDFFSQRLIAPPHALHQCFIDNPVGTNVSEETLAKTAAGDQLQLHYFKEVLSHYHVVGLGGFHCAAHSFHGNGIVAHSSSHHAGTGGDCRYQW